MMGMIVQMTVLSLCLIAVIHYLYVFFKTTLTVPKVKDLVNRPQKQYDAIFKAMSEMKTGGANNDNHTSDTNSGFINGSTMHSSTTSITSLPILGTGGTGGTGISSEMSANAMKQELKQFLKGLNLSKPNNQFGYNRNK
jgi:hypothetical protein